MIGSSRPPEAPTEVTELLGRWRGGDAATLEHVVAKVYAELRRLAQHRLRLESATLTLEATELVHEAYFRLLGKDKVTIRDRSHFLAVYSLLMRRILIDHARSKLTERRGSGQRPAELDERQPAPAQGTDWILVDQLLTHLQEVDPRMARIVELKFFGGLTIGEIAVALEVSEMTVVREWRRARAWLARRVRHQEALVNCNG